MKAKDYVEKSPTFCLAPFTYHQLLPNGKGRVCCEQYGDGEFSDWMSDAYQQLRDKMLKGEKVDFCKKCYDEEANGVFSARMDYNQYYQALHEEDEELNWDHPRDYLLSLNNTCPFKCRMCHPIHSSSIFDETYYYDDKVDNYHLLKPYAAMKALPLEKNFNFNLSKVKIVRLGGGEPFTMIETHHILDSLIKLGKTDIEIRLATSGMFYDKSIIDKLQQFEYIKISLSIDGVKGVNDYIRYGTKWKTIEKNVKKFVKLRDAAKRNGDFYKWRISVLKTFQVYNMFDWINLHLWSEVHGLIVETQFLYDPYEMSVEHVPKVFRQRALDYYNRIGTSYRDERILHWLSRDLEDESVKELRKLRTRTFLYDNIRNQHIRDYIPQVAGILEEV